MIPGEVIIKNEDVVCNKGRKTTSIEVRNEGDRPIQVGSHFHFFEVNKKLSFNRDKAFGMRLNIPASTAVRFEPGEKQSVELVEFGGKKDLYGFNALTNGNVGDVNLKKKALEEAKKNGFI